MVPLKEGGEFLDPVIQDGGIDQNGNKEPLGVSLMPPFVGPISPQQGAI